MRRVALAAPATLVAACLLGFSPDFVSPSRADGNEKEPIPYPVTEINPTILSTAWTIVPAGLGFAIAGGGEDGGSEALASGLLWGGLLVGPATGYWHGGAGKHAVRGLVIRGATFALASIVAPTESDEGGLYPAFSSDDDAKKWTWIGATTVIVASGIYDIARADRVVNHVERHHVSVVPTFGVGGSQVGLAVHAGF